MHVSICLLSLLLTAAPAQTADQGFVGLFPHDSLDGWGEEQHSFFKRQHPNQKTWSVHDGVVHCDGSLGNCGFLRYEKPLADFVLRLDYRIPPGCNSGVCIRARVPYTTLNPNTLPSNVGFEVQILDDAGKPATAQSTGSFYSVLAPKVNAARPPGEWNPLEIECRGPRIRVTLNGQLVQDVDQTKIPGISPRPLSGYLSLQNHGGSIEFRNLRLKELAAAGDRWEPQIRQFEQSDRQSPPRARGIVFLGSSSIRIWKVAESFPGLNVINRGFGGSQYADCARYVERIVVPCRPKTVVLYAGDNDLAAGKSPEQVLADFRRCVAKIHAALPEAHIVAIGVKPSIKRWQLIEAIRKLNGLLREATAKDRYITFVDVEKAMLSPDGKPRPELFKPDGLHMTEDGYKLWASLLKPHLD